MRSWRSWRNIATASCAWIAVTQLGTHVLRAQPCALQPSGFENQLADPVCAAWLEPEMRARAQAVSELLCQATVLTARRRVPQFYFNQLLHPALLDSPLLRTAFLLFGGVYALRWAQLLLLELPRCGRYTYANSLSASVFLTRALGILGKDQ